MSKEQKCKESQQGRIVIHKEDVEKRIYPSEFEDYKKNGWIKGVSEKHKREMSQVRLGVEPWNKGKEWDEETKTKISNSLLGNTPWNKNKRGVQSAWNKGLTKDTNESVAKISSTKMNHEVSTETRKKISNHFKGLKMSKEKASLKTQRQYETRKKNHTFNTSKAETSLYEFLLEENKTKTILTQYKDKERYPFYCDFYIVEDDLFIELNAHWTHGGKPFDANDEICQKQLAEWQEKAKTSEFYRNAIETWTIRDVEKLKCAEENHLNYKVIY